MLVDKWDKKILYELDKNARSSLSEIGHAINKSKSFVKYRLDNLSKNGVLRGFFVISDYSKRGMEARSLFIQIYDNEAKHKIIKYLQKKPIISAIFETTGVYKLVINIKTTSKIELTQFIEKLLVDFNDDIESYRILLSYRSFSPAYNFFHDKDMKRIVKVKEYNNSKAVPLSKKELDLFDLVAKNPIMSKTEMAIKMKSTRETITKLFNGLFEKGVLIDIKPFLNSDLLGEGYIRKIFIIELKMKGFLQLDEFKKYLLEKDEVIHLSFTMGSGDLFFTGIFKDNACFKAFEDDFVNKFSSVIKAETLLDYHDNYINPSK